MKKTIVTLVIVAVVAIIIAYRKPIGKFLAGDKAKDNSKSSSLESKMKAAMIVAAEQATDKVKKNVEAVEKKAQELDAQKAAEAAKKNADPAPAPEPEEEDTWFGGYDEENRIVKVDGVIYNIPNSERMKSVQANLIEGFQYLANAAVTPSPWNPMTSPAKQLKEAVDSELVAKYKQLVADMIEADSANIPKTGIDGRMNRPTALAFAECVRIMPGVVQQYKVEM